MTSDGLRSALWLPIFDALSDPRIVAGIAADAEAAGWDGVFVWDHLRWRAPVTRVADPWITLAAVAAATERLRFGPMVSPITRRRPAKLARETASLDLLGTGRLTLGVGLGSDRFAGEFSATGEQVDDRVRAEMLDEMLAILTAAWSGEAVHHRGRHFTVDDIRFLPRPLQRPGVPIWVAGFPGNRRPMVRAAHHQGYFPVNLAGVDQFAEAVAAVRELRDALGPKTGPYDFAVPLPYDIDPTPYAAAGATWCLTEFAPDTVSLDEVRGVLRSGPPATTGRPPPSPTGT